MKNRYLFVLLLLLRIPYGYAQEFTDPDSIAIIRNHVREVNITFTNSNGNSYPSKTYRYDNSGRMIYSADANSTYYYSLRYDSASRMCRFDQRKLDGRLIAGYEFRYYPDGKQKYLLNYSEYDTLHPNLVSTFDELGHKVQIRYLR